jgi:CRP/FNR family cyclic AMP-dependent transcriptional regulator
VSPLKLAFNHEYEAAMIKAAVTPQPSGVEILEKIPLFRGLAPEQLNRLSSVLRRKVLSANVRLMTKDQSSDFIYVILAGTVKVYIERPEHADITLAICGPGEILGDINAVDGQGHSASVTTLETCVVYAIRRAEFMECLHCMPQLTLNIASNAMSRLRRATVQIQALSRQDVYSRIACQLLSYADQYGHTNQDGSIFIDLRITQSEMADLIGASRVRVNQVFNAFKRSRYISIDRYRITLLNPNALRARGEKYL